MKLPAADTPAAVDAYMATLAHPAKALIQALRERILSADPSIAEGVKWNAPSFRTTEYFATMHLRQKRGIALVLHRGAKVKTLPDGGLAVPDPSGLLQWPASDRAMVVIEDEAALRLRAQPLTEILQAWIRHV